MRLSLALLLAFVLCPSTLRAQSAQTAASAAAPQIEFRFENAKLQPSRYTLVLAPDGSGHFHSEGGPPSPDDPAALPPEGQDRAVTVSAPVAHRIFAIARQKGFFAMDCENGGDSIAFRGMKTLSYAGPEGHGACTYNYSKDPQIQWLTDQCEGIASTLEEGRKLRLLYEHSPLTLDAELETLTQMVQNGQATELANIAPILQSIAGDDHVLQRAQRRARALLILAQRGPNK
jgi:hypothetical protein